jgi:hypothetical protein
MEKELLQKIEPLARLLLTPRQIGDLLELDEEQVAEISSQYSQAGRMYRRILAEKARELHEKTLRLADVGAPTALEEANAWLRTAQIAVE